MYGFGHFQADCPNKKALTIKEVEEIWAIKKESSEQEDENDDSTLVTPNAGELLLIKGNSMSQGFLMMIAKGNKSLTQGPPLEARFVA